MCIHVDDLKLAGHRDVVIKVLKLIEEDFGQFKIDHMFANWGLRHSQDAVT